MMTPNIFAFVKSEENAYETQTVRVGENWEWNMKDHIQMIFHLKNGVFYTGENNYMRAFKNIMEPIIELANWTEDIEVKDIVFYIEGDNQRVLSFLVKKYHDEVFVREHNIDEYIDQITESDNEYGGVLTQRTNDPKPEIFELNSVAFCDQTNVLGGTIGFKYNFTPSGIRKMSKMGWGEESNGATISIEELIMLADSGKDTDGVTTSDKNETTGKNIEVYVVRGDMPEHWLRDNDNMEDYYSQLQIIAFYTDHHGKKQGVILYRNKEEEGNLKFFTAKPVHGRGLGRGEGEKLIHPQIWTNFLNIHKTQMLESGAKTPLQTDDPSFTSRNQIQDMENLEVVTLDDGKRIDLVPTINPNNIQLYQGAIDEWFDHAQLTGAAQDPLMGKEPVSGTTFRGQERTVAQGRGPHDRKRGKRAKFIEEIYRDWIIPDIVKEIVKGKKFLATLTADEVSWITEQLATNYANEKVKEMMMKSMTDKNAPLPTNEDKQAAKDLFKEQFAKQGNQKMIEILEGEMKGIAIRMGINVANKQKDLANLSDKVLSIFQFVFANPQGFQQAMQIPALAKSFQDILEFSGLNQSDFQSLIAPPTQSEELPEPQQPTPELALNQPTEV